MSNINITFTLPGDHWLVGALDGSAKARKALGMLADELVGGLLEDGDIDAREHVLGLAKRAQARYGEAFDQVDSALEFDEDDPRFRGPRRAAFIAKRLAEILEPVEEPEGIIEGFVRLMDDLDENDPDGALAHDFAEVEKALAESERKAP